MQEEKNRPICPECGKPTIVLFSPPKEGLVGTELGYKLFREENWAEYIDWNKAHLYCCNGSSNCKYIAYLTSGNNLTN